MPRTPDGATPRDHVWSIRFTADGAALADKARGPLSRSAYVRKLVRDDVMAKQKKDRGGR